MHRKLRCCVAIPTGRLKNLWRNCARTNFQVRGATAHGTRQNSASWGVPVPSRLRGYYFENCAYSGFFVLSIIDNFTNSIFTKNYSK